MNRVSEAEISKLKSILMGTQQEFDPLLQNDRHVQDDLTRKFILFAALVLLSTASVYFGRFDDNTLFYPTTKSAKVKVHDASRCGPPKIPVWHPTALKYHSKVAVNCAMHNTKFTVPLFSIQQGNWLQRHVDLDVLGLSCFYRSFVGRDDTTNTYSTTFTRITFKRTEIPAGIEFIKVACREKNKSISYRDAFFIIDKNKASTTYAPAMKPSSSPPSFSPLNVVIIGLDATSRLNFKRIMPQASAYLLDELGSIDLEEYSVVGTGIRKNEIPLLTGHSYGEVKTKCEKGNHPCRSLFLFHEFANAGYITSLSEDYSPWTLESPVKSAFENTQSSMMTYYNRPLEVYMEQQQTPHKSSPYCFGPRVTLESLLNSIESVSQLKKRHFQLLWSGKISHDRHNALALGEPSLLKFLHNFKNSTVLNDNVLFVLADHGQGRFSLLTSFSGARTRCTL